MTEELVMFDGLDFAYIGTTYRNGHILAVYDYDLIIKFLMMDGMTEEEAIEFTDFNILGAWFGELTPIVVVNENRED